MIPLGLQWMETKPPERGLTWICCRIMAGQDTYPQLQISLAWRWSHRYDYHASHAEWLALTPPVLLQAVTDCEKPCSVQWLQGGWLLLETEFLGATWDFGPGTAIEPAGENGPGPVALQDLELEEADIVAQIQKPG